MRWNSHLLSLGQSFFQWSLPLKLLTSVVVALVGGGFLGYLAEFATYNYAIQFGFRVPIEGIPYLKAAVTFGSFFLFLTGVLVFALTWFALKTILAPRRFLDGLRKCAWMNNWSGWKSLADQVKDETNPTGGATLLDRTINKTWPRILIFAFTVAALLPIAVWSGYNLFSPMPSEVLYPMYIIGAPFTAAMLIAQVRPNSLPVLATVGTLLYFVGALVVLWTPTTHAWMLRQLGYGGGIPIRIELSEDHITIPMDAKSDLYLMSRTTEAYILFDRISKEFVEVPRSAARRSYVKKDSWHLLP